MTDYKHTLNLPNTAFDMKANLSQREPICLQNWEDKQIYKKIRALHKTHPKFILHDGPPYANGHLHCGHALNKILKDLVVKSKTFFGFDAPFLPGWDCHGLPIELNVEKKIGQVGMKIGVGEFRAQCRAYAHSQIEIQREEFKRLGVFGDWDRPYVTMDYGYEAGVVRVLSQLMEAGLVYQGFKPVHWCIDCASALAEAEVDYQDKQSHVIDVAFEVLDHLACFALFNSPVHTKRLIIPIWTTTPWTVPANEAVCLHPSIQYGLYETPMGFMIVATALAHSVFERYGIQAAEKQGEVPGSILKGLRCRHPFFEKIVPVILGDHVTTEAGTGCVHTAPAHGVEDEVVARTYGLTFENVILPTGCYVKTLPFFGGLFVLQANEAIIEKLRETNTLLADTMLVHSYPHCWRHKTPMIFLATPQWFLSMETKGLRNALLKGLENIQFIPEWGQVRMEKMISSRPDWCISRQRTWGSPIPILLHRETHKPHPRSIELMQQVADLIEQHGVEAWFDLNIETLIGEEASAYEKVMDTLDVWFDAGVSHTCILKTNAHLAFPADLYLEGSDQFRGWFNSSYTTAMASFGVPPFRTVLAHGYTVDATGKKLSKSQGNYVDLEQMIHQYGADLIRLWVASTDYRHEVGLSDEILKRLADAYRRIRNTARFLLANLFDFDPNTDRVPVEQLLTFDGHILSKAQQLQHDILQSYETYQFHLVYQAIYHFCNIDLGSLYLDIIKDRQYIALKNSVARRSCQTVMYYLLEALVRWLAPILSFTAEEIWQHMPGVREESVFLTQWYEAWPMTGESKREGWERLQLLRDEVNKACEIARTAKIIGSGLAAEVVIYAAEEDRQLLAELGDELRFFLITSGVKILPFEQAQHTTYCSTDLKLAILVKASPDEKCGRCWHRVQSVGVDSQHPTLCQRCVNTVMGMEEARQHV